ncbi:MAG: hypothetical protein LBV12_07920 [Puniceicoccales bacterium]|jgi:uncharacterized protein (TIGR02598 family)|nr:hypothetical protein [Puniceicoccales bacterium]
MQTFRISCRKGFSLVEVILAVGVIAMAILALVGLLGTTFQQVDDVVQTNRAVSVVSAVSAALDNPQLVGGERLAGASDTSKSSFEVVYDFVKSAVDKNKVVLYCFNREIDSTNPGSGGTIAVVYKASGDNFNTSTYDDQRGVGPVYRVEISISNILEEQQINLDPSTMEVRDTTYSGGPLPSSVDQYGLAYIPLLLEIYPHDFVDISVTNEQDILPVLSQNIIVNR